MINIIYGDLAAATENFICHQVNTKGVMGAGVAKALSDKYPIVKESFLSACREAKRSKTTLLGKAQFVPINNHQVVVNIFGQADYGRDKNVVYTDYDALKTVFMSLNTIIKGKSLAFPWKFGCGLANGDWSVVYKLIEKYFGNYDVTIYRME